MEDQAPSSLLIISSPSDFELFSTLLKKKYPSSVAGSSLITTSNKYFSSSIELSFASILSPFDADIEAFEAVFVVARREHRNLLKGVGKLVSDAGDKELKIIIAEGHGEEVDLEELYDYIGGVLEVVEFEYAREELQNEMLHDKNAGMGDEEFGFGRITEALENCMWKNRVDVQNTNSSRLDAIGAFGIDLKNNEEPEPSNNQKDDNKAPNKEAIIEQDSKHTKTEDINEEDIEADMDRLTMVFQQIEQFKQLRHTYSDKERREKAADLVMKLAAEMGGDEELDPQMFQSFM